MALKSEYYHVFLSLAIMASKRVTGSLVVYVFFSEPEKDSLNFHLQKLAFNS